MDANDFRFLYIRTGAHSPVTYNHPEKWALLFSRMLIVIHSTVSDLIPGERTPAENMRIGDYELCQVNYASDKGSRSHIFHIRVCVHVCLVDDDK